MRNRRIREETGCIILSLLWIFIVATLSGMGIAHAEIISADRRILWNPGVPGGIPARSTICANVKDAPYHAVGDGIADDTKAIKAAIASCRAGQVVYFPEGTYKLMAALSINKGIVLRGAGPSKSTLVYAGGSYGYSGCIVGATPAWTNRYVDVTSGYTKDSANITVNNVSGFKAGDYLIINQKDDGHLVTIFGVGKNGCTYCGLKSCSNDEYRTCYGSSECGGSACNGGRTLGQIVKVVTKDDNTNTLGIDPPLYFTYSLRLAPRVIKIDRTVEYAGLEDIKITQTGNFAQYLIWFINCANCWARNIETYRAWHHHIDSWFTYRNEYRDSYLHEASSYDSDTGYGIRLMQYATAGLVENNIFNKYHLAVELDGGPAGNVIAYNYATDIFYRPVDQQLQGDYSLHGAHPMFNLFEGNMGVKAAADNYWGSASHATFFRNRFVGYKDKSFMYDNRAIRADANQRYFNYVANILGTPALNYVRYETEGYTGTDCYTRSDIYVLGYDAGVGDCNANGNDPEVKRTILRHGNYDYKNNDRVWDPLISDRDIPASLYLSSKPGWWGGLPWPAVDPLADPSTFVNITIPAKQRFGHETKATR